MNNFTKRPLVNDYLPIGINRNPHFKPTDKVIFSLIYSMFQYTGIVFMSNRKLHNLSGVSKRRVSKSVTMFKNMKLIKCTTKMVTRNDGSKQRVRFITNINYGKLQQLDDKVLARIKGMYYGVAKKRTTVSDKSVPRSTQKMHYGIVKKIPKSNTNNSNNRSITNKSNTTTSSSSSMAPQEAPDDEDDSVAIVKSDKHLKSKAKPSSSESAKRPNDTRKALNRELKNNGRQASQQMSKMLPIVYDMNGMVKDIRFIRSSAEYKTRKREWEMLGASPQAVRSSTIKAVRNAKVRTVHSILNYVDKCLSALTD